MPHDAEGMGAGCRIRRGVRALALGFAVACCTFAHAADEPTVDDCLSCHAEATEAADGRRVTAIAGADYRAAAHADLGCTTCHADATDLPHDPLKPVGLEPCSACHEDAVDAFRRSVHARSASPGAEACGACHGDLHSVRPHDVPSAATARGHIARACARCHADERVVEKFRIPVARPVEAYLESVHARAIDDGRPGAVCSDCHGAHAILPSHDPASPISRTRVPETCGACHADVLAAYRESVHGQALARGSADAPSCTSCHGEHRILGPAEPDSPVFAANVPGETCGRCHANERLNEKLGLQAGTVTAFEDSFHGLALRMGRLTVANCASCHGVHDIRPSSDPRSHVSSANLAATCGRCHPGAGSYFSLGPVHAKAASTAGVVVAWVRFVYLWLIGLTIGGMVVHNVLDLARKARTPLPPPPPLADAGERMPRALRWQHRLVMLSFPVLVYTGFALTYPDQWWAAPFVAWETDFGLRGLLHRVAALVLMGGVAWHAIHVATSPPLRACLRGLVPSTSDVRVAMATLAYQLGRRPHPPRSGTFNYAEKVEYWAFLWGTVLMSVTGLLLWLENVTLRVLPGWVPDVATAIHFYEAVLATLAILVWHFYFVIFDPAVYPMDWTWWTGRSPAQRVLERLPGDDDPATATADRGQAPQGGPDD